MYNDGCQKNLVIDKKIWNHAKFFALWKLSEFFPICTSHDKLNIQTNIQKTAKCIDNMYTKFTNAKIHVYTDSVYITKQCCFIQGATYRFRTCLHESLKQFFCAVITLYDSHGSHTSLPITAVNKYSVPPFSTSVTFTRSASTIASRGWSWTSSFFFSTI